MHSPTPPHRPSGLPMALGAYLLWGFLPLYLMLVRDVPAFEFVGWRIIFTVPLCLIFVALRGQWKDLARAFAHRPTLRSLLLSAALIGINWTIYVAAIQSGQVFAASLGYYINPLANVLAGTLFLGERLTGRQWLAVVLAAGGVSLLVWDALDMLWISLSLAISFCAYGFVRKTTPVGSLPGLTIESIILLPVATAVTAWFAASPAGSSFGHDIAESLLIAAAGVVTAVPLLMFAVAARRMDYSTLGMYQFIAPSIVFILGLTIFDEPLNRIKLICFMMIWAAIALFVWDLLSRRVSVRQAPA